MEESLLFTLSKYKLVFDSQVDTKKEMLSRSSVALKKDLITCINCLVKSSVEYSVVHGGYYPIKLYTTHSRSSCHPVVSSWRDTVAEPLCIIPSSTVTVGLVCTAWPASGSRGRKVNSSLPCLLLLEPAVLLQQALCSTLLFYPSHLLAKRALGRTSNLYPGVYSCRMYMFTAFSGGQ